MRRITATKGNVSVELETHDKTFKKRKKKKDTNFPTIFQHPNMRQLQYNPSNEEEK